MGLTIPLPPLPASLPTSSPAGQRGTAQQGWGRGKSPGDLKGAAAICSSRSAQRQGWCIGWGDPRAGAGGQGWCIGWEGPQDWCRGAGLVHWVGGTPGLVQGGRAGALAGGTPGLVQGGRVGALAGGTPGLVQGGRVGALAGRDPRAGAGGQGWCIGWEDPRAGAGGQGWCIGWEGPQGWCRGARLVHWLGGPQGWWGGKAGALAVGTPGLAEGKAADPAPTEMMKDENIFLFVPNLIGYARVLLLFVAFYFMPSDPGPATASYLLSGLLDAFDGHAARALNQGTRFGAMLDMLTDRCATMCLLVNLALLDPPRALLYQLSMTLDIASHWLHLHSSVVRGSDSHKSIDLTGNPVLRVYYTSRVSDTPGPLTAPLPRSLPESRAP
uniref:CDP-diacylglycerol--inositol 3-phosphatidyltransferase n=1 Tax=Gopherus agassizii TaxID=38772 RepID=A0A452GR49_9SAUR